MNVFYLFHQITSYGCPSSSSCIFFFFSKVSEGGGVAIPLSLVAYARI